MRYSLLIICLLVPLHAFADLLDLPLGYLEIKDRSDGKINVEARCAKLRDILSEVSKRTKKEYAFECNPLTYETVYKPGLFLEPRVWLDLIGNYSVSVIEGNTKDTIVSAAAVTGYDASLTEREIEEQFGVLIPVKTEGAGTTGGLFVLEGQLIPPPYFVSTDHNRDGSVSVTLNGVPIQTFQNAMRSSSSGVPSLPASGQLGSFDEVLSYVRHTLYPSLVNKGLQQKDAFIEIVRFLNSQESVLVAFLEYDSRKYRDKYKVYGGGPVLAVRKGKTYTSLVFTSDYDFETPNSSIRHQQIDLAEAAGRYSKELKEEIMGGSIIFKSRGHKKVFNLKQESATICACLKAARDLSLLQRECIINELISDPIAARVLAVKLPAQFLVLTQNISSFCK